MGTFDQYRDAPRQIILEGETISVNLKRDGSNGTVTWDIPKSVGGCDLPRAYNGALITIDTTPTDVSKFPINSIRYISDNTANPDLHVGDKIGTALVVGFIYDDIITKELQLTDLDPNKSYYISLHAISNVMVYHTAGVHSYSMPITGLKTPDTTATHKIEVGEKGVGVSLGDATGVESSKVYTLQMFLDYDKTTTVEFVGTEIETYQELIDAWNYQAMLLDSPLQSPIIPNTGMYYYVNGSHQVFQWDGNQLIPSPVVVRDDAPNIQQAGGLWFNPQTKILYQSTVVGASLVWVAIPYIIYPTAPNEIDCGTYWFNGTDMFKWNDTVWLEQVLHTQATDPSLDPAFDCSTYWFDEDDSQLYHYDAKCNTWNEVLAQYSATDPTTPATDHLWFDDSTNKLYKFDGSVYQEIPVTISETLPTSLPLMGYWYTQSTMLLKQKIGPNELIDVVFLLWHYNPTQQSSGALWWNYSNDTLWQWDDLTNSWKQITNFIIGGTDPLLEELPAGVVWTIDSITFKIWDGSEWNPLAVVSYTTDPTTIASGTVWFNSTDNKFYRFNGTDWIVQNVLIQIEDPYVPSGGNFWFDSDDEILYRFDGTNWIVIIYSSVSLIPKKGFIYFDTTLNTLRQWNGYGWIDAEPKYSIRLSDCGQYLILESALTGSNARVEVGCVALGTGAFPAVVAQIPEMFNDMVPPAIPLLPTRGGDGLLGSPSYAQVGVGTDGTTDERRELIETIRSQLGYPTVEVELTKRQFNDAIDNAIDVLRAQSGMAYKQGYWFLQLEPRKQHYQLTDRRIGYNKIVNVLKIHRVTSAFLSNAQAQGTYGQLALQNLYHMGSFDLISYHLVSQYIETMEQLFATNIMFSWNEDNRTLSIFKDMFKVERVLMEVSVERTEQELMKDRYLKNWIERYSQAQCRLILADIRGKYGSLPGSGGGVSLNAAELSARADMDILDLMDQLDNYIVNNPDQYGMGSHMVIG